MKLTQNQKVAIYGSALQGHIISSGYFEAHGNSCKLTPAEYAIKDANELIAALEAMPDEEEANNASVINQTK